MDAQERRMEWSRGVGVLGRFFFVLLWGFLGLVLWIWSTNEILITFIYSSSLAFSLVSGWSFMESEDWSGCGGNFAQPNKH